jgi:hypothetical protein
LLSHYNGVDDGILYVIDGIPTVDRLDALVASAPDTEMIYSVEVITGNVPAEFGGRSGAVVTLQPKSGIGTGWWGSLNLGFSSFNTKELSTAFGGSVGTRLDLFFSASGNRSNPNVFFNTTIIFPNSVNKGFARGVDVRLDIPRAVFGCI